MIIVNTSNVLRPIYIEQIQNKAVDALVLTGLVSVKPNECSTYLVSVETSSLNFLSLN
jgi:hypothetical protein